MKNINDLKHEWDEKIQNFLESTIKIAAKDFEKNPNILSKGLKVKHKKTGNEWEILSVSMKNVALKLNDKKILVTPEKLEAEYELA